METGLSQDYRTVAPVPLEERKIALSKLSDCDIGSGKVVEVKALETTLECNHWHTEIHATVALNSEGAEYVCHVCGPQCIEAWCKAKNAHDR